MLLDILNDTNIPVRNILPTHMSKTGELMEQAGMLLNLDGYVDITANQNKVLEVAEKLDYLYSKYDKGLITLSSDANGSNPIWDNGVCLGIEAANMSGLHEIVKELVTRYNYSLEDAIKFCTINPAIVYKLNNKGLIQEGYDADLIVLDEDLEINKVFAKGKVLKK